MKGQVVYHPKYGRGVAGETQKGGLQYWIVFDSGKSALVRKDELTLESSQPRPHDQQLSQRARSDNFTERKVIEALRLGIVPDDGLPLFTLGRDAEIEHLRKWLETQDEMAMLIIGAYGSGKTHLLNYYRLLALDAGYAVSLIEMDPQETPFSYPKRVYTNIARNLEWRDGERLLGFRDLLERGLAVGLLQDHEYFKHMRRVTDPRWWSWIDGSDGGIRPSLNNPAVHKLPGMYDYTTSANIYCYLLSGLGSLCVSQSLNLRGLLVLFDESEALYATSGQLAVNRSVNFLDTLIGTARGSAMLLGPAFQTEFVFSGHASRIPFLYKRPSGLKLMFAFTSSDSLWISQELSELPSISLSPLETTILDEMLIKLQALYLNSYRGLVQGIDDKVFDELLEGCTFSNTRALVKGVIEALDIVRFGTYLPESENESD